MPGDLKLFRHITPFKRIALVTDGFLHDSIPGLEKLIQRLGKEHTLEITVVKAKDSAVHVLDQIPQETDAVFLAPVPRLPDEEFKIMADGFITRKLPSFSLRGRTSVSKGILAQSAAENNLSQLARQTAVNIHETINGEDPGRLSTVFSLRQKPVINMATARAINVYPDWDLLTEAELINEEVLNIKQRWNIRSAMGQALSANQDLAAAHRSVEAGQSQVKEARSELLPQFSMNTSASMVDDDRAKAYNGTLPERQWTGSIQASQLIYSDKAWAGFDIEKHQQTSRVQAKEEVRLDILQAAANAYLNVLRAKSIERIQMENLRLTRENLERARARVEIGAGGPEEVFRWESEIADSRFNVLSAQSDTLDTASAMNRVLNRPLKEAFIPEEDDGADPLNILPDRRLTRYMGNALVLNAFNDFLVEEGLKASPELQQIEAGIAAQKRSITQAKREFWVPVFSLEGDVSQSFAKDGKGSDYPSYRDDTDWTLGIQASLPLYTGGKNTAALTRSKKELQELVHKKHSTTSKIEEKIINAVHLVRASYPGIRLSNDAAQAARSNLTLVADAYARGIKSIIDLIDAQNQALVADQKAANAVYDFLIDTMTIQRSAGSFFLFAPQQELDAWMARLDQYMKSSRTE
jgi:outer membrane protein TolC